MDAIYLVGLLVLAIPAAGLYCWVTSAIRLWQGQPLIAWQPRRPVTWDLIDVGLTMVYTILLGIGASGLTRRWLGLEPTASFLEMDSASRATVLIMGSAGQLLAMGLSILTVVWRTKASGKDLGWSTAQVWDDLKLGAAAFVMMAPVIFGLQAILTTIWPSKHPLIEVLKVDPRFFAFSAFAAVLVAPIVEEYLFRVLLQGWLERLAFSHAAKSDARKELDPEPRPTAAENSIPSATDPSATETDSNSENPYRPPTSAPHEPPARPAAFPLQPPPSLQQPPVLAPQLVPIGISSAIFALLHYSHGPDWLPLMLLAFGMGFLYQRTHRILPSITVHFLLNATTMVAVAAAIQSGQL